MKLLLSNSFITTALRPVLCQCVHNTEYWYIKRASRNQKRENTNTCEDRGSAVDAVRWTRLACASLVFALLQLLRCQDFDFYNDKPRARTKLKDNKTFTEGILLLLNLTRIDLNPLFIYFIIHAWFYILLKDCLFNCRFFYYLDNH